MPDIDTIMHLFAWNNSEEEQAEGLKQAREVKCISAFFQPLNEEFNKNVWDNCAKTLCERTDSELKRYLLHMFEWLQDLNWPGAVLILERLRLYKREIYFEAVLRSCKDTARATDDTVWLENLNELD